MTPVEIWLGVIVVGAIINALDPSLLIVCISGCG